MPALLKLVTPLLQPLALRVEASHHFCSVLPRELACFTKGHAPAFSVGAEKPVGLYPHNRLAAAAAP
jgi:hypothetical protein